MASTKDCKSVICLGLASAMSNELTIAVAKMILNQASVVLSMESSEKVLMMAMVDLKPFPSMAYVLTIDRYILVFK